MKLPTVLDYKSHTLTKLLNVDSITSVDYVTGMHHDESHHAHDLEWELFACMRGALFVYLDGAYVPLRISQAILIPPGAEHDCLISDMDAIAFVVSFNCVSEYLSLFSGRVLPVTPEQEALVQQVIRESFSAYQLNDGTLRLFTFVPTSNSPLGAEQIISNSLEQFLILMLRNATIQNGEVTTEGQFIHALDNYLVNAVGEYIKEHISEGLTVTQVADAFHYSRSRLRSFFKAYLGHGIREYITNEQLSLAKQFLIDGELSIAEISERTGFSSPQYFSRKFTELVGFPPSQFRKTVLSAAEK